MRSRMVFAACAWALGLAAAAQASDASLPQALLERAYTEVGPAVCVLSYSYEVTNPANNERTKQDAHSPGLLVSPDGLIMARGHMATDFVEPFNIRAIVGRGENTREFPAVLLEKPSSVNVIFMRIQGPEALNLPHVRFPAEPALKLGEPVAILGVMGPSFDYAPTVIVRRIGAILNEPRATYCLDDPVSPGYVGGPVVNGQGEVVGVVGYDLAINEGGDLYVRGGYPLIFPANLFTRYVSKPLAEAGAGGGEQDAWLGVLTQPLTEDLAEYWGLPSAGGAVVSTIVPGSPAAEAGFQRGDIIVSFNGAPVQPRQDAEVFALTRMIREADVGTQVPVGLLRNGNRMDLTVTLQAQPKASSQAGEYEDEVFGLTVRELTRDVRILLNLPEDVQGVIVRRVESGSWAALARVRPGAIILSFGGHDVASVDGFKAAVAKVAAEKPKEVTIFARVGPLTGFFRLEPRWADGDK